MQNQQDLKKDLQKKLDDHYHLLTKSVKAETGILDLKIDQILDRNNVQDQQIQVLKDSSMDCLRHRQTVHRITKHWKLLMILAVIGVWGLNSLFHSVTITDIVLFIKSII